MREKRRQSPPGASAPGRLSCPNWRPFHSVTAGQLPRPKPSPWLPGHQCLGPTCPAGLGRGGLLGTPCHWNADGQARGRVSQGVPFPLCLPGSGGTCTSVLTLGWLFSLTPPGPPVRKLPKHGPPSLPAAPWVSQQPAQGHTPQVWGRCRFALSCGRRRRAGRARDRWARRKGGLLWSELPGQRGPLRLPRGHLGCLNR